MTGQYFYEKLQHLVHSESLLEASGYPFRDPNNPELCLVPKDQFGRRKELRKELASYYTCIRCRKPYCIDGSIRKPIPDECYYHPGKYWSYKGGYDCCKGSESARGCTTNVYHVCKDEPELENFQGFVETRYKPELEPNKHGVYAVDCQMCFTVYGMELIKVCVVDPNCSVIYEELVRPLNPVLDYNTKLTGIIETDMVGVKKTLTDVQQDLLDLFSSKTILIGHSLEADMFALKMFHKRFIDTSLLYPHRRGPRIRRALKTLAHQYLQRDIRQTLLHDCKEDAVAALELVKFKLRLVSCQRIATTRTGTVECIFSE